MPLKGEGWHFGLNFSVSCQAVTMSPGRPICQPALTLVFVVRPGGGGGGETGEEGEPDGQCRHCGPCREILS